MPAPANPTAAPASATSITLTWEAVAGASHYDIERNGVVIASDVTGLTWTDTTATLSAEHDYRVRAVFATAPPFNPETDITWHSLFWAEGTAMTALGLSDAASVTTWPNETGESDATATSVNPTYKASVADLNSQPAVFWTQVANEGFTTAAFGSNPTYPITFVLVVDLDNLSATRTSAIDGRSGESNKVGAINTVYELRGPTTIQGGTAAAGKGLWVARFGGSTADSADFMEVDGVPVISGVEAGAGQITGLTIGGAAGAVSNNWAGSIAFAAVYEGDITQHAKYNDFLLWANEHYGLQVSPFMSGGTITQPGDGYVYHTFTTSGTLTPIGDPVEVEYLVVAGGGGGGGGLSSGGGGGAGGMKTGTATVASAQTVTIGAGGSGGDSAGGSQGSSTSVGAISTTGGGAGLGSSGGGGGTGGSGGGAHPAGTGIAGIAGEGNAGGDGYDSLTTSERASGGGGGKGADGSNAVLAVGGDGGDGSQWPAASGTYYAGGGGGGVRGDAAGTPGGGGLGGGGGGAISVATAGTANTGGGGGGAGNLGGTGGSGITIVRYPVDYAWGGALADPRELPGLIGWWDASDASTITATGGNVTNLADKSDAGYDLPLLQGTPRTGDTTVNGLNVIDFVNGEYLEGASSNVLAWLGPDAKSCTTLAVFDIASVMNYGISPSSNRVAVDIRSGTTVYWDAGNVVGGRLTGAAGITNNAVNLMTARRNGNTKQDWRVNGVEELTTAASTAVGVSEVASFRLGNPSAGGTAGSLCEVVWWNRALSDAELALEEARLATKWAVTLP